MNYLLHFVNQLMLQELSQPKHANAYSEFNKAWDRERKKFGVPNEES